MVNVLWLKWNGGKINTRENMKIKNGGMVNERLRFFYLPIISDFIICFYIFNFKVSFFGEWEEDAQRSISCIVIRDLLKKSTKKWLKTMIERWFFYLNF